MDNVLKLLLGVVALSGVIALLVPSESPVAPPVDPAPVQAAAPAPVAQEPSEDEDTDADAEGDDEDLDGEEADDEDFTFGEPSIDGQPFGGSTDAPRNGSSSNANSVLNRMDNPEQTETAPANNNGNVVL
jgi:hypothetical protein